MLLCAAEALSMAGFSIYPALLPELRGEWGLTNTAAGLIGGALFGGYMIAVPLLVGLTDRVPARRVYLAGCLLLACGSAGFGFIANGVGGAVLFQALTGAGLAGTYMPGLKELSDRVRGPRQSRAIAFYTSTFGIGTSLSLIFAGAVAHWAGWRAAFVFSAAGPIAASALVAVGLPSGDAAPVIRTTRRLFDFAPVYRNRAVMGFILGYSAHCWELFALRSWMVAYFAYVAATHSPWPRGWTGPALAAAINLLGPPSSILGNEAAAGRRKRTIVLLMLVSAAAGFATGWGAALGVTVAIALVALYFVAIMSDSAALTAGLVEAADPGARGGAMALHSFGGFAAGFAAPLVFGIMLDVGGGAESAAAWRLAFGGVAAVGVTGALIVRRMAGRMS